MLKEKVVSLVTRKNSNILSKNSVFSRRNPLLDNRAIEISNNKSNFKIIEEKRSIKNEKNQREYLKNKYETQHNYFNINVHAGPNQDIRSLTDEVIKRIRDKSRNCSALGFCSGIYMELMLLR